ncbi:MAG: DMP19 family protein [Verrucomicrobiales bacterium]
MIKPIWDEISIYDGADRFLQDFAKVPQRPRTLFAAHWAQSEAMNGGLGQFFSNPTGVLAPEAVDAFKSLGMPRAAATLSDAMGFFGDPYPRDSSIREGAFDRFYDEHGEDAIPIIREEEQFAELIEEENGGIWKAADLYAKAGN